jgi:hypothetical protein
MIKNEELRKYIHDLANSFSVIDASLNRASTLLAKDHPELGEELKRIHVANEHVKKSIVILREFRDYVQKNSEP